jgi:hypothetical protein
VVWECFVQIVIGCPTLTWWGTILLEDNHGLEILHLRHAGLHMGRTGISVGCTLYGTGCLHSTVLSV